MDESFYDQVGGEDGVRQLCARFYHHMDTLPEAAPIRAMHPDLAVAEEKLFLFLSGWLGGPQLYIPKYGHPRLRMRHMPFPIDTDAARQWLVCMDAALAETVSDIALRNQLLSSFARVAAHMRNVQED